MFRRKKVDIKCQNSELIEFLFISGREACEQWYSEISKHDFNNEPRTLGSGM